MRISQPRRQLPHQSLARENGLSLLMLGMAAKIRVRLARQGRRKKTSPWRRRVNWQVNCAPRAKYPRFWRVMTTGFCGFASASGWRGKIRPICSFRFMLIRRQDHRRGAFRCLACQTKPRTKKRPHWRVRKITPI